MGSSASLAENQDETNQSGASRLMKSIFVAMCVAPLLIIGMVFMLGYNEQQAVCDAKAIKEGSGAVHQISCMSPNESTDSLVIFHCDIQKRGLQPPAPGGDFRGNYTGIGIKTTAEMYQCVESRHTETKKDKVGGGSTTITTYTYSREWRSHYVDSHNFHKADTGGTGEWSSSCGGLHNPPWGQRGLPESGSRYVPSIRVGPYRVFRHIGEVPLDSPIASLQAGPGWTGSGPGTFRRGSGDGIGDARVSFHTNDWARPTLTVVGKNDGGDIVPWKSSGAWLCPGNDVYGLKTGARSKESMFQQMQDEVQTRTWVLRVVGLLVLWLAFSFCCAPLGVVADCIPFLGPFLGDGIEGIACCVSCLPATACCLGIAGVVWCAMRPLVGIPLVLLWVGVMCGFGNLVLRGRAGKDRRSVPLVGGTMPPAPPTQELVQFPPGQRQLQVTVPMNAGPGTVVQVQTPEGIMTQVAVPAGAMPGSVFVMTY